MTEHQYLEQRLKDLLCTLSQRDLPAQYRANQENAFRFYAHQLRELNAIQHPKS